MHSLCVPRPVDPPCGRTSLPQQSHLINWETRLPTNQGKETLPVGRSLEEKLEFSLNLNSLREAMKKSREGTHVFNLTREKTFEHFHIWPEVFWDFPLKNYCLLPSCSQGRLRDSFFHFWGTFTRSNSLCLFLRSPVVKKSIFRCQKDFFKIIYRSTSILQVRKPRPQKVQWPAHNFTCWK